ncbi:hypothetical protein [Vibrio metschnikovii]|uniref:Uncharacterized protein n=1 Tax=Vibrio metschnikovii TaxID=28172 RepID=A0A9X0RB24_VIBME|nr:hypothetical protein [Vibrio metschnikovii]MBC5853044.1 hypothetical protein [Vibrio metschnikovii]
MSEHLKKFAVVTIKSGDIAGANLVQVSLVRNNAMHQLLTLFEKMIEDGIDRYQITVGSDYSVSGTPSNETMNDDVTSLVNIICGKKRLLA